jgi:ADP-heptose:LPS heptosyltransferase
LRSLNKGTKRLIKLLAKELFSENGDRIKDLIFICLNSFQDKTYKAEKYKSFLEMIIKELDTLSNNYN